MFKKLLITGTAGFVASHLADECIERKLAKKYLLLDAGFIGSNFEWNMPHTNREDVEILKYDLSKPNTYDQLLMANHHDIDGIIHCAAQSHVDRSISDGMPFIFSNVVGTARLLEFAKDNLKDLKIFLNFCTDEAMGQRTEEEGKYKPQDPKRVRNPYAASKSAQEELGFGYAITHKIPVVTTRCSNIYGPRQYPEKFLPVIITKLINGEKIPVYGEGHEEREWIYVSDVINATIGVVVEALSKGIDSQKAHTNIYHIGGEKTYKNIDFVRGVINMFFNYDENDDSKYRQYIQFVQNRKGHDFRYDLDCQSTHSIGLGPKTKLEEGLKKTIDWYRKYFKENKESW
jgi:dTDP-glucose 4,6-dehydratase